MNHENKRIRIAFGQQRDSAAAPVAATRSAAHMAAFALAENLPFQTLKEELSREAAEELRSLRVGPLK